MNKLDREGAAFGRTIHQLATKLSIRPLVMQLPYFKNDELHGIVDVLSMTLSTFARHDGSEIITSKLPVELQAETSRARSALIDTLSNFDEDVVNEFLSTDDVNQIDAHLLARSIRRACIAYKVIPVFCGASARNIGVQHLLDAVLAYLPSPSERPDVTATYNGAPYTVSADEACALAFKVSIDPRKGPLVFARIYQGTFARGSTLYNSSLSTSEKVLRIGDVQADEMIDLPSLSQGSIGVFTGLKAARTGDTLLLGPKPRKPFVLESIPQPLPVFFMTVEPHSSNDTRNVESALDSLLREDPSLHVRIDPNSGQTVLGGMGELHLEIASEKLLNTFRANCTLGQLQIGYRESIATAFHTDHLITKTTVNGKEASLRIRMQFSPLSNPSLTVHNQITLCNMDHLGQDDLHGAAQTGIESALSSGPAHHLPLHHMQIKVQSVENTNGIAISPAIIAHSLRSATTLSLNERTNLLEPVMQVDIIVPEQDIGTVFNDITSKRSGHILELDDGSTTTTSTTTTATPTSSPLYIPQDAPHLAQDDATTSATVTRVIHAIVPLSSMRGYVRSLRSMTGGRGTFTLSVHGWQPVQNIQQIRQELGQF